MSLIEGFANLYNQMLDDGKERDAAELYNMSKNKFGEENWKEEVEKNRRAREPSRHTGIGGKRRSKSRSTRRRHKRKSSKRRKPRRKTRRRNKHKK